MRKGFLLLADALLVAALLTGCGAKASGSASYSSAAPEAAVNTAAGYDNGIYYEEYEYAADEEAVSEDAVEMPMEADVTEPVPEPEGEAKASEARKTERKLIKTMNISAETTDLEATDARINERTKALGGYIENSNVDTAGHSNTSYDTDFWGNRRSVTHRTYRSASYTIRIPQEKLEQFAEELAGYSNITNQSYSVEDITLRYVDTSARKEALETEQAALLDMLAKAETVSEMIEIEQALSDVRYELRNIISRLNVYDNQVDYSTIYLNVQETTVLTDTSDEDKPILQRIADGFSDSVSVLIYNLQEFAVWAITSLPALVFIVLIIVLAVICLRIVIALVRFLFRIGRKPGLRENREEKARRVEREKRAKEREKDRERREREKSKKEKASEKDEEYIPSYITGSREERSDD